MAAADSSFHCQNAPEHNVTTVLDYLAAISIRDISHLLYSPDLAQAGYIVFLNMK
jgi:hypothetical protein